MSMPNPKKTAVRVQKVRLYPDAEMKQVLDELCDYRRYCWNEALALWNDMYEQSLILDDRKSRPSEYKVRNELVADKQDWQYALSARVLQLSVSDLNKAFRNFFNKAQTDWGKPKFKSKKAPRQGFKTDRAGIVNGKLLLDRPHESRHKESGTQSPSKVQNSLCGHIKQEDGKITLEGNRKHKTRHDEYICYECGAVMDRDENAVMNLLALA